MSIKGLTDKRRLPRLGKIHLGIKKRNNAGAEYPSAVDYFVCPPGVQKIYGEKPKSLRIMFPVNDEDRIASQYYRCYSTSRGLICKGDGERAMMLIDIATGTMATKTSKEVTMKEIKCDGLNCPYYGEQCREVMNLQFLLPDVQGVGIWQIDTSSINSIININSSLELIKSILGHIAMIPLKLTTEEQEVAPDGKKKKVHVLNLHIEEKLSELARLASTPLESRLIPPPENEEQELPVSDDEVPEMIIPEAQATDKPEKKEPSAPAIKQSVKEETFPMKTLGDLFTVCNKLWKLTPTQVCKDLGVKSNDDITDTPAEAFAKIKAVRVIIE